MGKTERQLFLHKTHLAQGGGALTASSLHMKQTINRSIKKSELRSIKQVENNLVLGKLS